MHPLVMNYSDKIFIFISWFIKLIQKKHYSRWMNRKRTEKLVTEWTEKNVAIENQLKSNLLYANNSIMDFSLSNLEKSRTNKWQHFSRFYRLENNGHFKLQMMCLSVMKSHINSYRKSVSVRCVFVFFQLTRNNSTYRNIDIFVSTDVVIPLVLFTNSYFSTSKPEHYFEW